MTLRTHRRICWSVIVVATVYLVGWSVVTIQQGRDEAMARSIKGLRAEAELAIAAKDWPAVDVACAALQKKKGGPVHAHALRGQMFQLEGKIEAAKEEYRAAYGLGDVTAGGSLAYLNKRSK